MKVFLRPSSLILIMTCSTFSHKAAGAATQSGITPGTRKRAFYLATAAAGLFCSGLLLARRFSRRQQGSALPSLTGPEQVKPLAALDRIEPVAADKLSGQRCAGCKTPAQGKGAWYNLGGHVYWQECALGQANKSGVTLTRPAASRYTTVVRYSQTGRPASLKPRLVKVGPVENVEGYAVWTGKRDTGLTLVPEVKLEANGQAKINKSRWPVNYDRAGKPIAGPYTSVSEVRGMASLLAHFDWTKEVENFGDEEIRQTLKMTREYREGLEFEEHMRQISRF